MGDRTVIRIRKEDFKKERGFFPRQKEEAFKNTAEKRQTNLPKKSQWKKFLDDEDVDEDESLVEYGFASQDEVCEVTDED